MGNSTLETRFWSKVKPAGPDECWEWTGARDGSGYGNAWYRGNATGAHRVSWILAHGGIPEGMCVLHRCDNPPCVNPAHLFLGTHRDNARDREAKGRRTAPRILGERNGVAKVPDDIVRDVVRRWRAGGVSQASLAAELRDLGYQCHYSTVSHWVRGSFRSELC